MKSISAKLKDWKTWLFLILPTLLILSYFALIIYEANVKNFSPQPVIYGMVILGVSIVLLEIPILLKCIKNIRSRRSIIALILIVVAIAMFVLSSIYGIKFIDVQEHVQELDDEWHAMEYGQDGYYEKIEELMDARMESIKLYIIRCVTIIMYTLLSSCGMAILNRRNNEEKTETHDKNPL